MKASALHIADVHKVYPTGVEALKGVTLDVKAGDFFALLGPNGAGKSTLISILAGLTQKTSGTVSVQGDSIDQYPTRAKSHIGIVPQEFNFDWFATVEDIVLDQAGYYGIPRRIAQPRSNELLASLGLWEKRNDQSRTLSGGMKRRLMIARALIHEPGVLLLDEPTAGVDVELRRSMWDFLRQLNAQGTTIILTTHYLEEAENLCNNVAIINHGQIIKEGGVKELITNLSLITLLIDVERPLRLAEMELLRGYPVQKVDDQTLKVTLKPGQSANDSLRKIAAIGVEIVNVRNPGSRLEEVFIELIENKE